MPGYIDDLLGQIMNYDPTTTLPEINWSDASTWPKYLQDLLKATNEEELSRRNQVLSLMQGAGTAAKQDAQTAYTNDLSNISNDTTSKGLNNTTIPASLRQNATNQLNRQNQRVDEMVGNNAAGVIERMSATPPNLSYLTQLMQSASRSPGAGGTGAGGGYGGGGGGGSGGSGGSGGGSSSDPWTLGATTPGGSLSFSQPLSQGMPQIFHTTDQGMPNQSTQRLRFFQAHGYFPEDKPPTSTQNARPTPVAPTPTPTPNPSPTPWMPGGTTPATGTPLGSDQIARLMSLFRTA